ncbi:MAG: hypothetical protein LBU50_04615, partial [Cellulomonas sp.]|nr:hypothetical protein [Cellulomonas sp.]
MTRRAVLGAVVVMALLAGCSGEPGSEPTSTLPGLEDLPSVDWTPAPQPPDPVQASKEAATSAYLNYVEVRDAVRQDYFNGWEEKVYPLTSGAHAEWVYSYFSEVAAMGRHQVGTTAARNVAVVEYYEDPTGTGHEQVVLNVCLDSTGVQSIDADGIDKLVPGTAGRFATKVIMQR